MAVQTTNYPQVRTVTQFVRALLADEPIAPGIALNPVSVAAAANSVTATFASPPGYVPNDMLLLSGWSPNAHNGVFQVAGINGAQVSWQNNAIPGPATQIGFVQGYGTGMKYTDPVLMPLLNSAYRALQRALRATGSTEFRQNQAFLSVPGLNGTDPTTYVELGFAGLSIVSDANPAPAFLENPNALLPSDVLIPRKLWEAPTGSGDAMVEMTDMTNNGGLPSRAQGMTLGMWEWADDAIALMGSLQNTDIRIEYDRSLPPVSAGADQLMVLNSEDYHAYATASLASGSRGGREGQTWQQMAEDAKDKLIGAVVRQQQFVSRRPRPFSSRRGYSNSGRVM